MSDISFIPGISPTSPLPRIKPPATIGAPDGATNFAETFQNALGEVNGQTREANKMIADMQVGQASIHETLIAVEKADLSFKLLMQVRNKVLEAYKEVMRTTV